MAKEKGKNSGWRKLKVLKTARAWRWVFAPSVRWLIMAGCLAALSWFVYSSVWLVAVSGIPLPREVGEEPPRIRLELLEEVNGQRLLRVQATPIPWPELTRDVF